MNKIALFVLLSSPTLCLNGAAVSPAPSCSPLAFAERVIALEKNIKTVRASLQRSKRRTASKAPQSEDFLSAADTATPPSMESFSPASLVMDSEEKRQRQAENAVAAQNFIDNILPGLLANDPESSAPWPPPPPRHKAAGPSRRQSHQDPYKAQTARYEGGYNNAAQNFIDSILPGLLADDSESSAPWPPPPPRHEAAGPSRPDSHHSRAHRSHPYRHRKSSHSKPNSFSPFTQSSHVPNIQVLVRFQ